MEKVQAIISEIELTEFKSLAVKCCQKADFSDLQTLFASRGTNTFVVFLRGLDPSKIEEYKQIMLNKEIEIIFQDFSICELSPTHTTIKWVDSEDGTAHTITKLRASSANNRITIEELRQMALDSLNARVANGAILT